MLQEILKDMGWKHTSGRWDKKEIFIDVAIFIFMTIIIISVYLIKD